MIHAIITNLNTLVLKKFKIKKKNRFKLDYKQDSMSYAKLDSNNKYGLILYRNKKIYLFHLLLHSFSQRFDRANLHTTSFNKSADATSKTYLFSRSIFILQELRKPINSSNLNNKMKTERTIIRHYAPPWKL